MAQKTFLWFGGSPGAWSLASNWTDITTAVALPTDAPPGAGDIVEITPVGVSVTLTAAGTVEAGTVEIGGDVVLQGAGSAAFGTLALATASGLAAIGQLDVIGGETIQAATLDLSGYFSVTNVLMGSLTIAPDSVVEAGSAGGAAAGALTVDTGVTVTLGAELDADLVNNGTVLAEGGVLATAFPLISGDVAGSGTIVLTDALPGFGGGGVEIAGAAAATQTIAFTSGAQILKLDDTAGFAATVTGFRQGDVIAVDAGIDSVTVTPEAGGPEAGGVVLSLFSGGVAAGTIALAGSGLSSVQFGITADVADFPVPVNLLGLELPCFAAGTAIATPTGPVAVEWLRPGDPVLNAWGEVLAVKWVGHRGVDCARHPRPREVYPVRIAPHAFAPGAPSRPLYLSPDHAVFDDGRLIPIRYLVNGATIAPTPIDAVTYFHIELDRHDVLLAEGLACETYLDTGNRAAFANGGVTALHPAFATPESPLAAWADAACGVLVTEDAALAPLRRHLLDRAMALGHALTRDAALCLDGVPSVGDDGRHRFRIRPGTRIAMLTSRTQVPAHLCAEGGDWRELGIAVTALRLDGVAVPLDSPRLGAGWHAAEAGWRWTGGAAGIDVSGIGGSDIGGSGATWLEIETLPLLEYWTGAGAEAHGYGRAIRMSPFSTLTG